MVASNQAVGAYASSSPEISRGAAATQQNPHLTFLATRGDLACPTEHGFVLDLDGTVYVGERPIRGTVEFIERNTHKKAFYFVTNNTSKLPEDYRLRLNAMGIATDSDHVITPLAPLIEYLQVHSIQNVYLLRNSALEAKI